MKPSILLILLSWAAPAALHGAVFMLDFGPTTASGAALTNSPYHTANPSFTQSSWNTIAAGEPTADALSGLVYSDGTAATGVEVNLGITAENSTLISLGTQPARSNALGLAQNAGVYAGSSVGRDGIFSGGTTSNISLGVQITGLAAGIYEVYIISRNTNTSITHTVANYAGAGTAGADFDYAGYSSSSVSYALGSNIATASWVAAGNADANYTKINVTLGAGQALNIAADSLTPEEARGFLNAIQVVQVPEPGTAALLSLLAAPFLLRRKR